jgi:hypothetical protein
MGVTMMDLLEVLPVGASLHSVTAVPGVVAGRAGLRVELTDEITAHGIPGVDYVDMPTFVLLPVELGTGMVEVEVLARLNGKTDFDARGFAGVAFGVDAQLRAFECVYVRTLNGLRMNPAPPRDRRAVQYFAYPEWPFDRLRAEYADGRYEAGADIGADQWLTLAVRIGEDEVDVAVDGVRALTIAQRKAPARTGRVALFVDIGTEAYFRNLRITPTP